MNLTSYKDLNALEIDTLQEVGSIGAGNAATALSEMLACPVKITVPQVRIMEYNEAIEWIGGPEEITAGVLVKMGGQINGIMLAVQQLAFVNRVLKSVIGKEISDYPELRELESSALTEVGNILISTIITALSLMSDVEISLTVPAFAVDMQGAILAVPMAEFGGQSDHLMTIGGDFLCGGEKVPCRLLLSPDIRSLNFLLEKLGVRGAE